MEAWYVMVIAGMLLIAAFAVGIGPPKIIQPIVPPIITVRTTTTSIISATTTIEMGPSGTYNATQQRENALQNGLNLSSQWFDCSSSQNFCGRVPISFCMNGLPSQSACINQEYYANYSVAYNESIGSHPHVCPLYIVDSRITCSCDMDTDTCIENYSG